MTTPLRRVATSLYERLLAHGIEATPSHVAVIQDGNRRYAREQGDDETQGHHAGAETTESVLRWCRDLGVEELTLYAFSTENFERPDEELESLFDLIETKLYEFADSDEIHADEVRIRAIGEMEELPPRVREAVRYAHDRTASYDGLQLNIALAYGGRAELLGAAREVARDVQAGALATEDIDAAELNRRLTTQPTRDVDLIIRTGGDERTSNFLPWHANGNEAAVFFCTPFWPEFRRIDFLRAIRTYESREASWRTTRTQRARTLVESLRDSELREANRVLRVGDQEDPELDVDTDVEPTAD
ncbi:di-trans,poly-cis-decaprenylcistransferase [Halosegnis rubeus]|jgi:tritrans,polycis-undecaprenyl-diphosphate synthase [geranylgeranyl-diphosphate specific]|uniref:Tritrans,polycis-undecaprenyl-diphosphate synthase (geranylgeranyl-diphosphate specific) n=1 Tax=Halosegnis rubeus TaxID=2212850 RepID=A0A5N5UBE6_9EURY|nr:polyprenyl diphosphate synthase [Halosegnis rubeus]KAB7515659.1 di-trans,poly-cis-decaprenylcistransferase [Halosegnis rubeus]KAB7517135.1 di-trans,poly-cis-decaprenylcistransferase [Halosegnis rubeus]KAB7519746.1 di-trans,poly-cis-decaprenylcistransferase [Halosegnis rubeus]